jgi:hypothetical protein
MAAGSLNGRCERVNSKNLPPHEIEEILDAAPPGLVASAAAQIGTKLEKLTPFTLQHAPKHRQLKHKNLAVLLLFKLRCRTSV